MKTMKAFVRVDAQTQRVELAEVPILEVTDQQVKVAIAAFGVGIHDRYFVPAAGPFP